MDVVETKEEFLDRVEEHVKKCFEEAPGEHETWEGMYIWMVAYFKSEDLADLSTKDMARCLVEGFPKLTIELAKEYIEEQFEGCEMETPAETAEMQNDLLMRVLDFMHE